MKRYIYLLAITLFLAACGASDQQPNDEETNDKTEVSNDRVESDKSDASDDASRAGEPLKITKEMLADFVPGGYKIHIWKAADLTKDGLDDVLMVVKKDKPNSTEDEGFGDEENRPLLILQQKDGKLVIRGRNDNAILCSGCGGIMGDPFNEFSGDFAVKNGYFSIEQSGGSNWRWQVITTFKYDAAKDDWFLHRDGSLNWHTGNPDKIDESVMTKKEFGTVLFKDYGGPNN